MKICLNFVIQIFPIENFSIYISFKISSSSDSY